MSAKASAEQPIARIDVELTPEAECSVAGLVATKSAATETVDALPAHGTPQPIDGVQDEEQSDAAGDASVHAGDKHTAPIDITTCDGSIGEATVATAKAFADSSLVGIEEAPSCAFNLVRPALSSSGLPREDECDVASRACEGLATIVQGRDCLATVTDATRESVVALDLGAERANQIKPPCGRRFEHSRKWIHPWQRDSYGEIAGRSYASCEVARFVVNGRSVDARGI